MSAHLDYFPAAFKIVIGEKGGYVNDPRVRGMIQRCLIRRSSLMLSQQPSKRRPLQFNHRTAAQTFVAINANWIGVPVRHMPRDCVTSITFECGRAKIYGNRFERERETTLVPNAGDSQEPKADGVCAQNIIGTRDTWSSKKHWFQYLAVAAERAKDYFLCVFMTFIMSAQKRTRLAL